MSDLPRAAARRCVHEMADATEFGKQTVTVLRYSTVVRTRGPGPRRLAGNATIGYPSFLSIFFLHLPYPRQVTFGGYGP